MATSKILNAATVAPTTSNVARTPGLGGAFQAVVNGTGPVAATVVIEASLNGTDYLTIGTITLSGTNTANDGFAIQAPWEFVRGRLTAISGTGAAVDLFVGVQ